MFYIHGRKLEINYTFIRWDVANKLDTFTHSHALRGMFHYFAPIQCYTDIFSCDSNTKMKLEKVLEFGIHTKGCHKIWKLENVFMAVAKPYQLADFYINKIHFMFVIVGTLFLNLWQKCSSFQIIINLNWIGWISNFARNWINHVGSDAKKNYHISSAFIVDEAKFSNSWKAGDSNVKTVTYQMKKIKNRSIEMSMQWQDKNDPMMVSNFICCVYTTFSRNDNIAIQRTKRRLYCLLWLIFRFNSFFSSA